MSVGEGDVISCVKPEDSSCLRSQVAVLYWAPDTWALGICAITAPPSGKALKTDRSFA